MPRRSAHSDPFERSLKAVLELEPPGNRPLAERLAELLRAVDPASAGGAEVELRRWLPEAGLPAPPGDRAPLPPPADDGRFRGRPEAVDRLLPALLAASRGRAIGKAGQVFTPPALAERAVALLDPAPGQRWLDPAAGTGALLRPARAAGVADLHAGELDPLLAALGRRLLPAATWSVGDALAVPQDLPDGWAAGFDRVVTNPPYRNGVEARDPAWLELRAAWKARFETARGAFDSYVPFVQRCVELLRPGGRLAAILPDKWLAAGYGAALRSWLSRETVLLRLQHAPRTRLFAEADFEPLLLVCERRGPATREGKLRVETLDGDLRPTSAHSLSQAEVAALAPEGWGPLLRAPARRLRPRGACAALGERRRIAASLTTAEYYALDVREGDARESGPRLLSSGAIEPFRALWGEAPTRFRGARWQRPLARLAGLSDGRRRQVGRPRVLLANLSRRLEAFAAEPGRWLGVVNVIQVFCADEGDALRLAAWLNAPALDDWLSAWAGPLRLSGQLALSRPLVARLPEPPDGEDGHRLAELGERLQRAAGSDPVALAELEALAAAHFIRGRTGR